MNTDKKLKRFGLVLVGLLGLSALGFHGFVTGGAFVGPGTKSDNWGACPLVSGNHTVTLHNSNDVVMTVTLNSPWAQSYAGVGSWVSASPVAIAANADTNITYHFTATGTCGGATPTAETTTGTMKWQAGDEAGTNYIIISYTANEN